MKILLLFLLSIYSWAGPWVAVDVDHANLLYGEGEKASFVFRKMIRPVSPDYTIETKIAVNGGDEEAVEYQENTGAFVTEALGAGETEIAVHTKILGPFGFEKTVQSDAFHLTVNSGAAR